MTKIKAQVDIIFLIVAFLAITISFVIIFFTYGQIHAAMAPALNPTNNTNTTVAHIFTNTNTALTGIGTLLVLVYFGIGLAAIISAFFVEGIPIFYIVSMFALIIQILVAVIAHNIFFTIVQQNIFSSTAAKFTYLLTIFEYYPELSLIISLGILIALYSK